MRYYVNKKNEKFIDTLYDKFKINEVNDIYAAVGCIIQQSQEWEYTFRNLCKLYELYLEDLETATLNKMNIIMRDKGFLTKTESRKLKNIIQIRNDVNHKSFMDKDWSYPFDEVEETLNSIFYLICDGIDFINNKINDKKGIKIQSPTLLNSNKKAFIKK